MIMLSRYKCTLLESISRPPWERTQDWNLLTSSYGEKRIPFRTYVLPNTSNSVPDPLVGQTTSFYPFSLLPAELQLHILSFCSGPTLFQLMHTSSALRAEASKFFWSNPDAYFVVATQWLLDGAYPGYQCCDAAFLQYVQNVEIEYPPEKNDDIRGFSGEEPHVGQDRIEIFWNGVQRRFPRVKRVVINQIGSQRLWTDDEAVPQPLRTLMQACPRTIQVSTLTFEVRLHHDIDDTGTTTVPCPQIFRRSMYKLAADNVWRKLDSRHSQTILLPTKRLGGLVGEHQEAQHQFLRMEMESSEWCLAIEALERYHFDNGKNDAFSCPMPECDAYFEKAGEWTVHAVESSHGRDQGLLSHFPDEIREKLDAITKRLQQRDEEISARIDMIRDAWYNAGREERNEIERDWIKQLENTWGAKMVPGENKVWDNFVERMGLGWDQY